MDTPPPNTYHSDDQLDLVTSHEWYPVLVCDWRTGDIDVTSKQRSQRSWMRMDEWHGHMSSFTLPEPTDAVALSNFIRQHVRPLVDRVIDGYDSEWDGRNLVAVFDDDALAARADIKRLLEKHSDVLVLHEGGYYDPADYLAEVRWALPVSTESTDDDLESLAEELVAEARMDSCVLERDLTICYLEWLRAEYQVSAILAADED